MRTLAAATVAACLALPAGASVLNIDDSDWIDDPEIHYQDGFSFNNSAAYNVSEHIYLHDDGGLTSSTFRRADGRHFSMLGALIRVGSNLKEVQSDGTLKAIQYLYSLTGFRDGVQVASIIQSSGSFGLQSWGNVFSDLTSFTISLLLPPDRIKYAYSYSDLIDGKLIWYPPGTVVCQEYCAFAHIDDVEYELAPVPIPASMAMLLGGLGLLAVRRRFRQAA